ncbi:hypothetical protein [uncultured Thiodictyon sp.]|jgi:hypothetical protein|uniref:hypothetical protein n=1 Tax=uncultured Thiodictyon sp. TaxID=1846217 RepID=UPI0025FF1D13|nr:hypothetical protein [uncultured Thiodictyon sp.]
MLHRLEVADCRLALEWIVKLQTKLMTALCDPKIQAPDITAAWAQNVLPDIESDWVSRYCGWYRTKGTNKHSMLERMKALAALPTVDRHQCLVHLKDNLEFCLAFDPAAHPPATRPRDKALSKKASDVYRELLEAFYLIALNNGFPVKADGSAGKDFKHADVVTTAQAANPKLKVCPLCDGGKDGSELDHWLPKENFPELCCHPYNLVEICAACNGTENKGSKPVLNAEALEPFADWFHPYLRSAHDTFAVTIAKGMVSLDALDPVNRRRVENLDCLVNLGSRWTNEYRTQFQRVQEKIRCRIGRRQQVSAGTLETLLIDWREDARAQIGLMPNAMMEVALLSIACDTRSHVFEELSIYADEEHCAFLSDNLV